MADSLSPKNILIVDDDPTFARLLEGILKDKQHNCIVATEAAEGLQLAMLQKQALIDLDFFKRVGQNFLAWVQIFVNFIRLFFETLYWIFVGPFKGKPIRSPSVFEQMVFMGAQSILIVFFVLLFTGIVLAMQSAYQLSK